MSLDKSNLHEMAHIGEELLNESTLSDLDRKCLIVKESVQGEDFSLDEALKVYGLSRKDYETFIAKNLLDELKNSAGTSVELIVKSLFALEVIKEMYKIQFDKLDTSSNEIIIHLEKLSKDIKEGKVHA
jgi:hypothetical protein